MAAQVTWLVYCCSQLCSTWLTLPNLYVSMLIRQVGLTIRSGAGGVDSWSWMEALPFSFIHCEVKVYHLITKFLRPFFVNVYRTAEPGSLATHQIEFRCCQQHIQQIIPLLYSRVDKNICVCPVPSVPDLEWHTLWHHENTDFIA